MENAKKERAREKQLKAEKKKLELAKKWTKADKRNFKEALYALGFPESLNTVSEVDNQNESAEASKDNKVTLANLCSKPDQTSNETDGAAGADARSGTSAVRGCVFILG